MTSAELVDVRSALARLRAGLESLRQAEGDSPYVRRLVNDLDRFQLDMEDMPRRRGRRAVPHARAGARNVVRIKDGPYHHVPWQDADDEGIGGHRR
ncbi:hypothetical protein OK074_2246 [Actinobacteria bacterium OK074]|nr:hypothetical protein OK074_2246 [Actinobacteria bacterium OK074]